MFENLDDPRKQALLALAAGLFSPVRGKGFSGFGEALGQGVNAGLLGFNQAQRTQEVVKRGEMDRKLEQAKLDEFQRKQAYNTGFDALSKQYFQPGVTPSTPVDDNGYPMPSSAPKANLGGFIGALPSLGGQGVKDALGYQQLIAKDSPYDKPKPEHYTPESLRKFAQSRDPGDLVPVTKQDLPPGMRIGANGQPEWIPGFLEGKGKVAAAGAPRVDVKYGEGLGKALGTGTAEVLNTGRTKAESAAESIQMGHTILNALDSGPVYTGPGATLKLKGQQVAQLFGLNPDPEGMQRARTIITGLANQTVNSRGLLKGQGQITEYEQKTLEKAKSGNIDDLTPGEIRTIIQVNERVSRAQIKAHAKLVATLGKNKDYAEVIPFFQIDEPGHYSPSSPPGAQGSPSLVDIENEILRRRGQGGRP